MTNVDEGRDERQPETAMRQFVALRRREGTNMLNRSKVGRLAREAGLDELAAAVEERRYYELVERYRAESRFDDENVEG
ncbi:hypothetical protein [Halalkalicoccus ordinarius]|uniref:hypothetical protein n=1 Tax=Halalkalicoccus ordinarius TaxID=3116651 RepID=UPI00300F6FCA